jgi:hypothetical protein
MHNKNFLDIDTSGSFDDPKAFGVTCNLVNCKTLDKAYSFLVSSEFQRGYRRSRSYRRVYKFYKMRQVVVPLVAWGLLSANLLFGQTAPATTGTVTGHVRGPGGVSVPGATVQLTNPQTGERKETWTDEAGNYTFTGLIPGNYRLDVSLVGFRADSREPVPVTPAKR